MKLEIAHSARVPGFSLLLPDRFVHSKNVSDLRRSGRGTKPDK
jgi:hypothetical protein